MDTFALNENLKEMKVLFTLCIFFASLSMYAQESIKGIWNLGEDNTKIEIKEVNGFFEGRIVSSDNPKAKRGNLILKNVKLLGGKWEGNLFSPKKMEWFDAVLKLEGKKLLVTVSSGWRSKTVEWTKA